ncbi:hypothetical protein AB0H71_21485 [Nocardia sp. NPDC050697]|uniref:hypothetical protein n=1 Tax=Nocardia sp. NPDC050697 TaxID=3155158 RepID=UPI003402B1C9
MTDSRDRGRRATTRPGEPSEGSRSAARPPRDPAALPQVERPILADEVAPPAAVRRGVDQGGTEPLVVPARGTVEDRLELLAGCLPDGDRDAPEVTLALAVLRGALLDLLATGDLARIDAALRRQAAVFDRSLGEHRRTRVAFPRRSVQDGEPWEH